MLNLKEQFGRIEVNIFKVDIIKKDLLDILFELLWILLYSFIRTLELHLSDSSNKLVLRDLHFQKGYFTYYFTF